MKSQATRKERREALIQDSLDRMPVMKDLPKLFISESVIEEDEAYPEELQEQEQIAYELEQEKNAVINDQYSEEDVKRDAEVAADLEAELNQLKEIESHEQAIFAWQEHLSIDRQFISAFYDLEAARKHLDKALDNLYAAENKYQISRKAFHEDPLREDTSHIVEEYYYSTNAFFKPAKQQATSEPELGCPRFN